MPDLEQAFAIEKNDKVRSQIEFELKLLRDGDILKTKSDGSVRVTAFSPDGVASRSFRPTEIDQRGIEAIVAQFASDPRG